MDVSSACVISQLRFLASRLRKRAPIEKLPCDRLVPPEEPNNADRFSSDFAFYKSNFYERSQLHALKSHPKSFVAADIRPLHCSGARVNFKTNWLENLLSILTSLASCDCLKRQLAVPLKV